MGTPKCFNGATSEKPLHSSLDLLTSMAISIVRFSAGLYGHRLPA